VGIDVEIIFRNLKAFPLKPALKPRSGLFLKCPLFVPAFFWCFFYCFIISGIPFQKANLNFIEMKQPKILKNINLESVNHLEADINYTIFNLKNGNKFVSAYSLKFFENLFDDRYFIRINRSNLVNKSFIAEIICRQDGNYIRLNNIREFLIPRRRNNAFKLSFPNQL